MYIMIDIDKNVFTRLFDNGIEDYEMSNDDLCKIGTSIRRGTPLPPNHGDLIDRNDLLQESYCIDDCAGNEVNVVDVKAVKMAQAIIKANTESEDK